MLRVSLIAVPVALAVIGWSWGDAPPEPQASGYRFPQAKVMGSLSCASSACHNSGDPGRRGGEYTMWADRDPHARAFDVLYDQSSRDIVAKLGSRVPAHENADCLGCHAPEAKHAQASVGVGCESCHGPAEHYLVTHYTAEFKAISRRDQAERYGLYPTKDLAFRVGQCASCHVGDATREVNHDLIAAGHPRLAFEYTAYHRSPKSAPHWTEKPDFEGRAWEIGQVATARSAAALLQARATNPKAPWPELSEGSCFACHQGIGEAKWKPLAGTPRKAGVVPWGSWHFATLDDGDRVARLMESLTPKRSEVARECEALIARLDRSLARMQADSDRPFDVSSRFDRLAKHALSDDGTKFRVADWDGATQHYLGLAALHSAGGGRDPKRRALLEAMAKSLSHPPGYNSPRDTEPAALLDLFRQLQPRGDK